MVPAAEEIARRLQRDARRGVATRYFAGWRLNLTYGPYEDAVDEVTMAWARSITEQVTGSETDPVLSRKLQQGLWHLSASWRGGFSEKNGRTHLVELLVALGVPEDARAGIKPIKVFNPNGQQSPQVTHWMWKDPPVQP